MKTRLKKVPLTFLKMNQVKKPQIKPPQYQDSVTDYQTSHKKYYSLYKPVSKLLKDE